MQQISKLVRTGRGASGLAVNSSKVDGRFGLIDIRRPAGGDVRSQVPQGSADGTGRLAGFMAPDGSGKALLDIIVLGLKLYAKHRGA